MGPTASGKTDLAIALQQHLPLKLDEALLASSLQRPQQRA